MKYLNVQQNNNTMDYYDHLNNGETYTCDKCEVVDLSESEYNNYIQFQFHYCELCWNYIHLKTGKCSCGCIMTNRNEYPLINVTCGCGKVVELVIEQ